MTRRAYRRVATVNFPAAAEQSEWKQLALMIDASFLPNSFASGNEKVQ
jgi:hypothetical protein